MGRAKVRTECPGNIFLVFGYLDEMKGPSEKLGRAFVSGDGARMTGADDTSSRRSTPRQI